MWGKFSTTCCNVTEVAQCRAPSCSRPTPARVNGVRDCRSNFTGRNPSLYTGAVPLEIDVFYDANVGNKFQDLLHRVRLCSLTPLLTQVLVVCLLTSCITPLLTQVLVVCFSSLFDAPTLAIFGDHRPQVHVGP